MLNEKVCGPISQTRVQFLEKHKGSEQGAFWRESPACISSEESTKHKLEECVCDWSMPRLCVMEESLYKHFLTWGSSSRILLACIVLTK